MQVKVLKEKERQINQAPSIFFFFFTTTTTTD
jgi:hypothetical protein